MARNAIQPLRPEHVLGRNTVRQVQPMPDGWLGYSQSTGKGALRSSGRFQLAKRVEGGMSDSHSYDL